MKRVAVSLVLGAFLSGCASVYVCDKGDHCIASVNNTCWYLFNWIPVASGNPDRPNANSTRLFRETVTLENNMKILETVMRERHAPVVRNMNSSTTDESLFFFLLTRHACHTSAELLTPMKDAP